MSHPRTTTTGFSKLSNRKSIQVNIDIDIFDEFRARCQDFGMPMTDAIRQLIIEFNNKHRPKTVDEKVIERAAHLKNLKV